MERVLRLSRELVAVNFRNYHSEHVIVKLDCFLSDIDVILLNKISCSIISIKTYRL